MCLCMFLCSVCRKHAYVQAESSQSISNIFFFRNVRSPNLEFTVQEWLADNPQRSPCDSPPGTKIAAMGHHSLLRPQTSVASCQLLFPPTVI